MFPQKPGPLSSKIFISWIPSYNSKYRCHCVTFKDNQIQYKVQDTLCHFKMYSVIQKWAVTMKRRELALICVVLSLVSREGTL